MKLKNKVIVYISCLFIFAVLLMAFKIWTNYKNILDFENKLVEKNLKHLIDTITISHEKLQKTIELYRYDIVSIDTMVENDHFTLRDSFIRDDFTHMFLLDKDKAIVKSIVYFQELHIFEDEEEFLKNYSKPLELDKIYFATYDFEKIFFTIQKLDKGFGDIKYIALGKAINSEFLSLITRVTENFISFEPNYTMTKDNKQISIENINYNYTIDRLNDEKLFSYLELYDDVNDEKFYLSMQSDRTIFSNILHNNLNIFYIISILLLLIIVSLYYFITRYFTHRIENISNSVKQISKNKELNITIPVEFNDEITYLSKKMNIMLRTIDNKHFEEIKKERDFLQSILDAQESIILITDGNDIKSTNEKFNAQFDSHEKFLTNIALLDNSAKENFLEIIKSYSSFNNPAKIQISDNNDGYFVFDVKKIDFKNYVVSMNDISDINQTICTLNQKASFDTLTKVYNKQSITCIVEEWIKSKTFALCVIDIDFFKKINDTFGHSIGDYILRDTCALIQGNLDKRDVIGRFGGEEFIVLIEDENKENILAVCERIREVVEGHTFIYGQNKINITVSIGVSLSIGKPSYEELFNEADKYLYEAKESGRNRISDGF